MNIPSSTSIKSTLKIIFSVCLFLLLAFPKLSASTNISVRPNQDEGPTPVHIAIYVIDIENVDNIRQHFISDFMVFVRWKDERLAGEKRMVNLEEIWWPNASVLNGRNLSAMLPKRAEVDEEGNVLYRQRFYGDLASPFDLKEFPFDKQNLPISIVTLGNTPEMIELIFNEDASGNIDKFSNSDWDISDGVGSTGVFETFSSSKNHVKFRLPIVHFEFEGKRHVFYYIWKVIIPLLVIVMMSWAVFYIEPSQVAPQIGLGATSILTLIAFLFSLGKILPQIAYLTKIDFYVYSSLALVFLAFAEGVITIKLSSEGNLPMAKHIDKVSRWLFPLVFSLILITFYIL